MSTDTPTPGAPPSAPVYPNDPEPESSPQYIQRVNAASSLVWSEMAVRKLNAPDTLDRLFREAYAAKDAGGMLACLLAEIYQHNMGAGPMVAHYMDRVRAASGPASAALVVVATHGVPPDAPQGGPG